MNRLRRAAGLSLAAFLLGACARQQPPPPPPLQIVPQALAPQADATPTPPNGDELLAQQRPEVRAALARYKRDGSWQAFDSDGHQLYAYGESDEPVVECEPLRSTDIQLQAGETITDVVLGDSERWQATPAASGDPQHPVPHVAIKPQVPGIKTNLTIYTTRHIYHLNLGSRTGHGVDQVEFYYPDELLAAIKQADLDANRATLSKVDADAAGGIVVASLKSAEPAALNFSYQVSGPEVPWKPVRAFDDGTHVYIQMPPGMKTTDAPALLIAASSGNQMVNYRVRGNYYVVDCLFEKAVMVAGVGRQQDSVNVSYTGASR